jgi:hypothetical protein
VLRREEASIRRIDLNQAKLDEIITGKCDVNIGKSKDELGVVKVIVVKFEGEGNTRRLGTECHEANSISDKKTSPVGTRAKDKLVLDGIKNDKARVVLKGVRQREGKENGDHGLIQFL